LIGGDPAGPGEQQGDEHAEDEATDVGEKATPPPLA
jgi:hypothetical protein